VRYRPLALQLLKRLPKLSRVAALLEGHTAKDTLLDLMAISDLAWMSKVYCFLAYLLALVVLYDLEGCYVVMSNLCWIFRLLVLHTVIVSRTLMNPSIKLTLLDL
jgi:hypothetical protein